MLADDAQQILAKTGVIVSFTWHNDRNRKLVGRAIGFIQVKVDEMPQQKHKDDARRKKSAQKQDYHMDFDNCLMPG